MIRKLAGLMILVATFAPVLADAQSDANADTSAEARIKVDVWAPTTTISTPVSASGVLSREFAQSALQAVAAIRDMQTKLAFAIEHGYPISEFSIGCEREQVADAVKKAELSVLSDADRAALHELQARNEILRGWTDWLIEAHQTMHLGDYYMSAAALENNELSQKLDHCSQSMASMLVRRRVQEDYACR